MSAEGPEDTFPGDPPGPEPVTAEGAELADTVAPITLDEATGPGIPRGAPSEAETLPGEGFTTDETVPGRGPGAEVASARGCASGGLGFAAGLPTVAPESYARDAEIARGGMGRIVAAVDARLGRRVALKEVLGSAEAMSARFEREALITARLQHPSIVPVYEAGRWPGGEPFFAMKLVDGRPLDEVVAEVSGLRERLALLPNAIAVADALAYAHERGYIHRDLKPQNVLVGAHGETVVIDWGLARTILRACDEEPDRPDTAIESIADQSAEDLTVVGSVMGTPAYMPLEQARGERVDARADVYALGAILYHLLCGEPPYGRRSTRDTLAAVIVAPPTLLQERAPEVPRDLAAIVDKAMARSPSDRYAHAGELAEELRRFQTGQLVGAHAYTLGELVWRFVTRHKAVVGVALVALAAVAGIGGYAMSEVVAERDVANSARIEAEAAGQLAEAERGRAVGAMQEASQARARAEQRFDDLAIVQARTLSKVDPTAGVSRLRNRSAPERRWRQARTIAADALSRVVAAAVLRVHEDRVRSVDISADGSLVVSASYDHTVRVWDRRAGTIRTMREHSAQVRHVDLSPDGRYVASAGLDHRVGLWDAQTGEGGLLPEGHRNELRVVRFSPDSARICSGGKDGDLRIWDVRTRTSRAFTGHTSRIRRCAWSPDGQRVVTGSYDRSLRLWDLGSGASKVLEGHGARVRAVEWSPDGRLVASGDGGGEVRLWDPTTGEGRLLAGHRDSVNHVGFSRSGKRLVSSCEGGEVRVWDTAGARPPTLLDLGQRADTAALFDHGRRVAAANRAGRVRVHDLRTGAADDLLGYNGAVDQLAVSEDGRWLVAGSWDTSVRVWPPTTRVASSRASRRAASPSRGSRRP